MNFRSKTISDIYFFYQNGIFINDVIFVHLFFCIFFTFLFDFYFNIWSFFLDFFFDCFFSIFLQFFLSFFPIFFYFFIFHFLQFPFSKNIFVCHVAVFLGIFRNKKLRKKKRKKNFEYTKKTNPVCTVFFLCLFIINFWNKKKRRRQILCIRFFFS